MMPDLTPNYAFRIPKSDGTDFIVPDDVRVPVTSIDSTIKSSNNRMDKFDTATVDGTLSGAAALVIAANWTLTVCTVVRRGKFVQFAAQVVRINSAIAGTADGNIGNLTIGTVVAGYRPAYEVGISSRATGPIWGGYVNQAGVFGICALVPNYTLPINGTLTASACYMIP
jgi:hypothetical protein